MICPPLIEWHLKEVKFRDGVLISAELGKGNQGRDYVLRKPQATDRSWFKRMFASGPPVYTFHLHPRDESGAQALSDLNNRGINLVANALAQSSDHVVSFFKMLRTELAFYVGCLNLHERLASKGEPITFPVPFDAPKWKLAFRGLYDVCLLRALSPALDRLQRDAIAPSRLSGGTEPRMVGGCRHVSLPHRPHRPVFSGTRRDRERAT
jgi:hypothetical protein